MKKRTPSRIVLITGLASLTLASAGCLDRLKQESVSSNPPAPLPADTGDTGEAGDTGDSGEGA